MTNDDKSWSPREFLREYFPRLHQHQDERCPFCNISLNGKHINDVIQHIVFCSELEQASNDTCVWHVCKCGKWFPFRWLVKECAKRDTVGMMSISTLVVGTSGNRIAVQKHRQPPLTKLVHGERLSLRQIEDTSDDARGSSGKKIPNSDISEFRRPSNHGGSSPQSLSGPRDLDPASLGVSHRHAVSTRIPEKTLDQNKTAKNTPTNGLTTATTTTTTTTTSHPSNDEARTPKEVNITTILTKSFSSPSSTVTTATTKHKSPHRKNSTTVTKKPKHSRAHPPSKHLSGYGGVNVDFLEPYVMSGRDTVICPACDVRFEYAGEKLRGTIIHILDCYNPKPKQDWFFCRICGKGFPSRSVLNTHQYRRHPGKVKRNRAANQTKGPEHDTNWGCHQKVQQVEDFGCDTGDRRGEICDQNTDYNPNLEVVDPDSDSGFPSKPDQDQDAWDATKQYMTMANLVGNVEGANEDTLHRPPPHNDSETLHKLPQRSHKLSLPVDHGVMTICDPDQNSDQEENELLKDLDQQGTSSSLGQSSTQSKAQTHPVDSGLSLPPPAEEDPSDIPKGYRLCFLRWLDQGLGMEEIEIYPSPSPSSPLLPTGNNDQNLRCLAFSDLVMLVQQRHPDRTSLAWFASCVNKWGVPLKRDIRSRFCRAYTDQSGRTIDVDDHWLDLSKLEEDPFFRSLTDCLH